MSAIEEFNPVEWLNQFSPGIDKLDYDTLEPILSFTLIWNLFEMAACHRNASVVNIRRSVDRAYEEGKLSYDDFSEFVAYFKERYQRSDDEMHLSERLIYRRRPRPNEEIHIQLLEDVLNGKATDMNNIVFSLLFVAYRVRNNLFHGEKDVFTLNTQTDLFKAVNALLGRYLQAVNPSIQG